MLWTSDSDSLRKTAHMAGWERLGTPNSVKRHQISFDTKTDQEVNMHTLCHLESECSNANVQ